MDKVFSNEKLLPIIQALGAGIGEDFNIDNLKYFDDIFENADSFKHTKTVLKFYNKCKSRNYKKKLQSMLETLDIKELYIELKNDKTYYKKNKDFIKKLENIYYDELKDIIVEY